MEEGIDEIEMKKALPNAKLMKRPLLDVTVDEEAPPSSSADVSDLSVSSSVSSSSSSPHVVGSSSLRSSTLRAALNTIKSIVGVGILSFPFAFYQAGLVFGLISVLIIAIIVNYGMRLLVEVRVEV